MESNQRPTFAANLPEYEHGADTDATRWDCTGNGAGFDFGGCEVMETKASIKGS